MDFFKVIVSVNGRDVESVVKSGVLASIEIGAWDGKTKKPEDRVIVAPCNGPNGPAAWVQVSKFANGSSSPMVTHEGWSGEDNGKLRAFASQNEVRVSIHPERETSEKSIECAKRVEAGKDSCCTSYGSGCYVTCCNGCCSDSTRCPGASCCG